VLIQESAGGDKIVIDTTASRLHRAGNDGDSNVL
jgi:hypothetical protein